MPATPESLQLFVSSCQGLKDEKSDSQTFLNRFFQAFGYSDAIAAGAVMEKRIKKGSKAGNMGFADLVWVPGNLPGVIIEMTKARDTQHCTMAHMALAIDSILRSKNRSHGAFVRGGDRINQLSNAQAHRRQLRCAPLPSGAAPCYAIKSSACRNSKNLSKIFLLRSITCFSSNSS